MGKYIEALILYVLLFFSGSFGRPVPEGPAVFSAQAELTRILLYNIPSLALIWYLLLKSKTFKSRKIGPPGRKDLFSGLLVFPALLLIGFIIAFISARSGGTATEAEIAAPEAFSAWIFLGLSCISTGYLEESFFRFYLLSKREELGLKAFQAVTISVLLFSLCHLYEGPWGFLNALLSAIVLSFAFLRYRSLHGIALAHGLYNIFVYVWSAVHQTGTGG